METPKVSIVIPIYNVEKYLKASVDSALAQTYENIEIILVDDGSPDNCPAICDDYSKKVDKIITIHKANGGLSDARNYGIEKSTGAYILFLDSDDTLEKNAVKDMLELAIKNNYDAVLPDRYYLVHETNSKKELNLHFDKSSYLENPIDFAKNVIIGKGRAWRATAVLYSSSIIKNNNILFPVGYTSEDFLFNLKFMSTSKKIGFFSFPTLNCLKRSGSISRSFSVDYFNTILFIDMHAKQFSNNYYADQTIQTKVNSLYCRNIFVYFISIYKSSLKREEKNSYFSLIVNHERTEEALKTKFEIPYFEKKYNTLLMIIIHFLMVNKLYYLLKLFLIFIGKLFKGNKK